MHQHFHRADGKVAIIVVPRELPEDVDGGQRHVVGEVQGFFAACLTMGQSHVLLPIAVEKLNLESYPLKVKNVLAGKRPVSGEVDFTRLRLLVRAQIVSDHDLTYAVKAVNPYFSSVKDHPFSTLIYKDFGGEDVLAEVVKVNPLSKLAVTPPCLLRSDTSSWHCYGAY